MGVVRAGIATLAATVAATAAVETSASAARAASPLASHDAMSDLLAAPQPAVGPRPARRIEELAAQLGLRRVRQLRARAVADLNRAATDTFGPLDAARASILGRRSYFEDRDVEVFVTGATDLTFLAVPIGTVVTEAGEVVLPPPDPTAYSAPAFIGPWGSSTTTFFTATNTDDGGVSCDSTSAHTILRASWRKLADRSAARDYWGIDLAALAEVTEKSSCNDFVDDARIGFRSATPGALVVAEDPASGRTQQCATRTVSIGSSWGGVGGSVSQAFSHCEKVGVTGALQPAGTTRMVIFDNNGSCHAGDAPFDGRELAQVAVVEVAQGGGHGLVLSVGVNAGNASTCKEDAC